MSDAEFILSPTLDGGLLSYVPAASRRWRRVVVAAALIGADVGVCLIAVQIGAALSREQFTIGMVAVPVLILLFQVLGLYDGFGPSPYERVRIRVQGIVLLVAVDCVTGIMSGDGRRLIFLGLTSVLLLLLGYYAESFVRHILIRHGLWGGSVAFVGAGPSSDLLARFLLEHPEFGLRPAGFLRCVLGREKELPLPALGDIADLERVDSWVEVMVFASPADMAAVNQKVQCRLHARRMVMVGDSNGLPTLWIRTRSLGGLIGLELCQDAKIWNRRLKRLLDLLMAVPACAVAAPVIAAAAVAIKIIDPGPAFYFQERVGMDGRTIRVCKLRTMSTNAESRLKEHLARNSQAHAEWQRFFKLKHDPRILPLVGSFLRRTSLDELPQLWKVLTGQMSLVGPRPFPCYHVESFDAEFQAIRSSVPPGLSGLWQVAARSNGDLDVQRTQDLFYILNWSIWLDIYILLETPIAVIAARGAR